jgi:CRP/FNR family transcriptional regulator, anaerobic regulatory protein
VVNKSKYDHIIRVFPALFVISKEDWEASEPTVRHFAENKLVFAAADFDHSSIFILQGTVRITNLAENGKASAMNRISEGDVCSLMVLSSMSQREYLGYMTAETPIEALFIKKSHFVKWIGLYPEFRSFIFENILDGFIYLTDLINNVLFQRLDLRLAKFLLERTTSAEPDLHMTHEQIAGELGTAREVISRMLKRFKDEGYIESSRGRLQIKRRSELEALQLAVDK